MDSFSSRPSRPGVSPSPRSEEPIRESAPTMTHIDNTKKPIRSRKKLIILVASLLGLLLVATLVWTMYRNASTGFIDSGKYQAVFLSNGQVYFGKLHKSDDAYFKLTDIYYLQAQTKTADAKNPQETSAANNDVQLIKLGSEIHGPEDSMIISKEQILFFENLKSDGKVTDTITKYKNEKK